MCITPLVVKQVKEKIIIKCTDGFTLHTTHQAHTPLIHLASGCHYRALSAKTSRHQNRFFPQAINPLNN